MPLSHAELRELARRLVTAADDLTGGADDRRVRVGRLAQSLAAQITDLVWSEEDERRSSPATSREFAARQ